jgi:hypothetical protein
MSAAFVISEEVVLNTLAVIRNATDCATVCGGDFLELQSSHNVLLPHQLLEKLSRHDEVIDAK